MKVNVFAIFFTCVFCGVVFSLAVPYPTVSNNLLSANEQKVINDSNEDELIVPLGKNDATVYNINWFNGMDNIFTKYVVVKVIDIYSKKEYYVKRMGGYNHADVQVVDSKNLEIFKEVYGGVWSWKRRPVWVEIDGKYYAGSTNGMPHGFDVLNIGENGHTCIHFLQSKTHGSKKVDPDHQACVAYAYNNRGELADYLIKWKRNDNDWKLVKI